MAWSSVYTAGGNSDSETSVFMLYFVDTYLNGKAAWDVSAHPGGDSARRSVKITLPNVWEGGAARSCYWWFRFGGNPSSGGAYDWRWYADRRYTSEPGDTGTYDDTDYTMPVDWHDWSGSWRIWESDIDAQAILVTKGKYIAFYWPGSTEWAVKVDPTWDGSSSDEGTIIGPYIGQTNEGLMLAGYPVSPGSSSYSMVPDMGGNASMSGFNSASSAAMAAGVGFISTTGNGSLMHPNQTSQPLLPRTGADALVWLPGVAASTAERRICDSLSIGSVIYNTTTSNYYLAGDGNLTTRFMLWDMGPTEPDFS